MTADTWIGVPASILNADAPALLCAACRALARDAMHGVR